MQVATAQLQPSTNWEENLTRARAAIDEAADRGAALIAFPELFMAWRAGMDLTTLRPLAQSVDGPFVEALARAAHAAGIWVICGMLEASGEEEQRPYNTTVVLDGSGELVASYRKTHLYDAFGTQESAIFTPGEELFAPIRSPLGCTGLFVCYELRFPEVARHQAERGADVLIVPSAWVAGPMKEYHWRHLIITRAIENTVYLIAPGQVGNNCIGRSLIVDPMGVVLAEGSEVEGVIYAEVEADRVCAVREKLPSLRHRRTELY
jgi:predicted amidohydrolase